MRLFSWRRARAILSKEFKHILRDPFTLVMALLLPLAIVLVLGNSIEFNVQSINLGYFDADRSAASRQLIETFGASDYFRPYELRSPEDAFDEMVAGRARAALIVPPNFEGDFYRGDGADVQLMVDGANSASTLAVLNYLTTISQMAPAKIREVPEYMNAAPLTFKTRYMFNPELNSRWFSVPGLVTVIVALVAIMMTTLTVCREWERGSMEMLLSTPATTLEIVFGKVVPYAIMSFIGFVLVFVVARLMFGVPFVGSYFTLILATLLFILGYLAIGLLISVSTHKQEVAIQFAIIIGLLPTVVLSGFIFPVEYMSHGYKIVSHLFPASFYIDVSRDQFLKGSAIVDLWLPFAAMGAIAVMLIIMSLARFKRTLE